MEEGGEYDQARQEDIRVWCPKWLALSLVPLPTLLLKVQVLSNLLVMLSVVLLMQPALLTVLTKTPRSENYKYAEYDLTGTGTNTWYGGLVQEGLAFAMGGGAIGAGAKALGAGKAAQGVIAVGGDAVLDYFTELGQGNISNLVQSGPLANTLSAALAHSEEDNPHWRRIKNSIEGIPSIALTAVSRFYKGACRSRRHCRWRLC